MKSKTAQPPYEIGKTGAAMLRRSDDPSHEPVRGTEMIQTHVIVQESTERDPSAFLPGPSSS
ncbi:MAG TPA: hypothetical protein PLU87_02580 [Sedimentisphaerales bacterium]|nr:hypothetical protein [Sedimentisphaerales bacterium]